MRLRRALGTKDRNSTGSSRCGRDPLCAQYLKAVTDLQLSPQLSCCLSAQDFMIQGGDFTAGKPHLTYSYALQLAMLYC